MLSAFNRRRNWIGAATCACGLLLAFLPALSGCGGPESGKAIVKGRIVQDGEPLDVQGREVGGRLEVVLISLDGKGQESVLADEEGYFEFVGNNREGVPAGKYKIAVKQIDIATGGAAPPGPPPDPTRPFGDQDALKGAFNEQNSPIIREIGEGDVDLGEIDLAQEKK